MNLKILDRVFEHFCAAAPVEGVTTPGLAIATGGGIHATTFALPPSVLPGSASTGHYEGTYGYSAPTGMSGEAGPTVPSGSRAAILTERVDSTRSSCRSRPRFSGLIRLAVSYRKLVAGLCELS